MIDPREITNFNRILPEGKGYVEIRKDTFLYVKPIYIPLSTKQNVKKYGTKFMRMARRHDPRKVKLRRTVMDIGLDAVTALKYMKKHDLVNREQIEEFKGIKGNLEKFKYLYSITDLRFVI